MYSFLGILLFQMAWKSANSCWKWGKNLPSGTWPLNLPKFGLSLECSQHLAPPLDTWKHICGTIQTSSHSLVHKYSPIPLKITWKRGTMGRSTKLSSWLTRASLTILYPEINTVLSPPLLKLNTGPYAWASCIQKQVTHQEREYFTKTVFFQHMNHILDRNKFSYCQLKWLKRGNKWSLHGKGLTLKCSSVLVQFVLFDTWLLTYKINYFPCINLQFVTDY